MENFFICPKCRSKLMSGKKIVISAKSRDGSGGLLSLNKKVGDYAVDFPETLNCKPGELLELYCPVCHKDLASSKHINLAMLIMTDKSDEDYEIYFSRIVGEHSTVVFLGDHVTLYGEHADRYQDLFNTRQMF